LLTHKNLIGLVALSSSVKTILVCHHNDITLTDVELKVQGVQTVRILTALRTSLSPALA